MASIEKNGTLNGNGVNDRINGSPSAANGANGTNGANGANGAKCPIQHNGYGQANGHKSTPTASTDGGPVGPLAKPKKEPGFFASLSALKQLSKRPLPTAMGDGTYPQTATRPKLRQDLRTISIKGR